MRLVALFSAVVLIASGPATAAAKAKTTPTPSDEKRVEDLKKEVGEILSPDRLGRRETVSISFEGSVAAAAGNARGVLSALGYDFRETFTDGIDTTWRVSEKGETPPRSARRYSISVMFGGEPLNTHPYCLVVLRVDATNQIDEGDERWVWREWTPVDANDEERAAFMSVVGALKEKLPKPDPSAPPPGAERSEIAAAPNPLRVLVEPVAVEELPEKPIPIYQPQPPYPARARSKNLAGVVVVEIVVNRMGIVTGAKVVKSVPDFDDAALSAVKKWRYTPVILNDERPVSWKGEVSFRFDAR